MSKRRNSFEALVVVDKKREEKEKGYGSSKKRIW